ncbi:hypothetical protein, partial [Frateuria defendens]|uniref:hypothetical protein n=1 Tax=Frateuria defendens TaxID=2219559 RepID=UPI000B1C8B5C
GSTLIRQTFGGQAIQQALGVSPGAAELIYGALGGTGEAYAGLSLLPAWAKAATVINADGTLTLTGGSNGLNAVNDFELLAKGAPATPTPGGYVNQVKVCGSQCALNISDPADQAVATQIALNGDPTGELTESLINSVAQKQGMTVLEGGKYGGNRGFDAVLQNSDGSVTLLVDGKQINNGTFSLSQTTSGDMQLSSGWIQSVMDRLDKTSPAYKAISQAQEDGTLTTAVVGVNKNTGQLIGVPVKTP